MGETIEIVDLRPEFKELINFSANDAAIEKFKEHLELRVCGFNDGEGYALCKEARKDVKKALKVVENQRETFKKPFWDAGKAIDAEAKRLKAPLNKIVEHLDSQIKPVDEEKKRRAEEAKKEAIERIARMRRLLSEVGAPFEVIEDAVKRDDEAFEEILGHWEMVASRKRAEEKAQAEHLRKLEEEAEKSRAQAAEVERIEREKQAAIEAENRKLREQLEAQRQKELEAERARVEAAEEARRKAEAEKQAAIEQAKREKREAEEKRLREEQERLAAEAQKKAEKEERIAKEQAAARKKAKDKALFDKVAAKFTTLPECHTEIVRLINLLEKQKLA